MTRTHHRVRRSYDLRLRDAIAATHVGAWRSAARGRCGDVELKVYELLEQVDKLRQRTKTQASIIGLLARLLKLRAGNVDADRVPDGQAKSALLRAIASASGPLSLGTTLKNIGISSARYHAWRRKEEGCGLDDRPSCPKSSPSQLTRKELSTMRGFVESDAYRHIAVQNRALYAQRLGKLFASASTWYKVARKRG